MSTSDYSTHSKRYKKYVDYESEESGGRKEGVRAVPGV